MLKKVDVTMLDHSLGAWAEFGPLFNGIEWNEGKCSIVPLLCGAVQQYIAMQSRMTTTKTASSSSELCGANSSRTHEVELYCGSDTIVTILRLYMCIVAVCFCS